MKVSGEGGRGGGKQRANGRGSSTFHGHGDDGNVIHPNKKSETLRTENREKEVCEKIELCVRFI